MPTVIDLRTNPNRWGNALVFCTGVLHFTGDQYEEQAWLCSRDPAKHDEVPDGIVLGGASEASRLLQHVRGVPGGFLYDERDVVVWGVVSYDYSGIPAIVHVRQVEAYGRKGSARLMFDDALSL
ncbi:MAG: hypothetical protein K8I27_12220 [Planctomycetes bacterium]|nr:hypothetical protein [Planctomycetota bacterium]